jgi:hypothetical protein
MWLHWRGIVLALAASLYANAQTTPNVKSFHAFLQQYCFTCHNERAKTAGLTLEKFYLSNLADNAEVWEKVIRKLRSNAMPPAGLPRPDKAVSESFTGWMETSLDRAAASHPNPGHAIVHRLNRAEYANAIRDLLSVEIDAGTIRASVLTTTPTYSPFPQC